MVFSRFGSGRQSWQLQASKASFLVGAESDVRHWHGASEAPLGPACHVRLGGWKTASFLVGSESNVTHWGPWQEVITSSKGKKQETRNKKQEARNKKPGKQQEEQENEEDEEEDPSFTSSRFRK